MNDSTLQGMQRIVEGLERGINLVEEEFNKLRDTGNLVECAIALYNVKDLHATLDEQTKRLYHVKDLFEKNVVPTIMLNTDSTKISIDSIGRTFSVQQKYSASFIDKELGFGWLRERGDGDMITTTVNAGTLASYVKEMVLEQGIDPPEEIVKFSTYYTIGITKYTPKKKV